jgi:hypothetical protein
VTYYRDDAGPGGEPSAKPVPGVGVDRTLDATADATTDGAGAFAFGGVSGDVTVTTVAKFGTPRASDHNGAISSFDASIVGRAAAGLLTLSPNQRIAGDVTGDGTISAFDASYVGRFSAGLIDHFDVATTTGSDWKFLRCDAYAYPGDPGCVSPAYNFTPVSQAVSAANFHAILYGDVTGNWQAASLLASSRARPVATEESAAIAADHELAARLATRPDRDVPKRLAGVPAGLSIDRLAKPLRPGERADLTVRLDNAGGILGLDLSLTYDASRFAVVGVRVAGIGSDCSLAQAGTGGTLKLAMYGVLPLSGSGPLLTITVEARTNTPLLTPLKAAAVANEGRIPIRIGRQH